MSTQHEALELANRLRERYGATVPTSQAAKRLEQQHALIVQMAKAIELKAAARCFNTHSNANKWLEEALGEAKDYLK